MWTEGEEGGCGGGGCRRAHVGQTAILNWRRQRPWRHQDRPTAATVISPGIKFLPASAFCARDGGRSLQRAADIFYAASATARIPSRDRRSVGRRE